MKCSPLLSRRACRLLVIVLASATIGCRSEDGVSETATGPVIGMSAEDPALDPVLRRLFAAPDDYDLVEGVYNRLSEKVDHVSYTERRNTSSLSAEQRVVFDVWYAQLVISDGDLSTLLTDDGGVLPTLPASLEAIGATEEAQTVREAQALLPDGALPIGDDEASIAARSEAIENLSQEDQDRLTELSERFWTYDRRLVRRAADYVRTHKHQFAYLPKSEYEDYSTVETDNLPVPAADASEADVVAWLKSMDAWVTRRGPFLAGQTIPVTVPRAGNVVMQVNMPGYRRTTDEELKHMAELQALQEVRAIGFSNSWVTRNGLQHLQKFPHLQVLSFYGSDLTDDWLDEIVKLQGLRELDLSETAITDAGVKRLAELSDLRRLVLNDVEITDEGVAALAALTKLEELELSTRFGGAGLKALGGLPIRRLNLDHSNAADEGLAALGDLKQLKELELRGCQFGPDALAGIGRCTTLEKLILDNTSTTDDGLRELSGLVNLTELSLHNTSLRGEGFAELTGLKQLKRLYLYGAKVDDAGAAAIARLPALETLILGDTQITNQSLASFATMKSLKTLSLSQNRLESSAEIRQLEKLTALQSLTLPSGLEDDPHVKKLEEKLPDCDVYCF